jgi:hypothetical protein
VRHTKGLWALVVALIAVSACGPSDHAGRQFPVPPPDSYSISTVPVSLDGSPEQLEVATVSREFFKGAGVRPFLGRFFEEREHQKATPAVVVLAYELWQRRLRGSQQVIGTALNVNGQLMTVIGVAAPGFAGPAGAQAWMPRIEPVR